MDKNNVDIRKVVVMQHSSKEERMKDFLSQIGNPYQFQCGKITINIKFNTDPNSPTLSKVIENLIL